MPNDGRNSRAALARRSIASRPSFHSRPRNTRASPMRRSVRGAQNCRSVSFVIGRCTKSTRLARSPTARVIGVAPLASAGAERICSGSEGGEQFGHLFDGIAAITAIMRYAERRQKLAGSFSPPQHRVPSVLPFEAEEHPRFPDAQVGEGCAELPVGLLCHRQVHEIHAAGAVTNSTSYWGRAACV